MYTVIVTIQVVKSNALNDEAPIAEKEYRRDYQTLDQVGAAYGQLCETEMLKHFRTTFDKK